jgi:hypothetical protein
MQNQSKILHVSFGMKNKMMSFRPEESFSLPKLQQEFAVEKPLRS